MASSVASFMTHTDVELAGMAERGLPLLSIEGLKEEGLTYTEISEVVIAPRTLKHRKSRNEPLSREESDRVLRMVRIVELARNVFGSAKKALLWLRTPDDRLGDRTPLQMLVSEAGGRAVEKMLWQIDEGVYS